MTPAKKTSFEPCHTCEVYSAESKRLAALGVSPAEKKLLANETRRMQLGSKRPSNLHYFWTCAMSSWELNFPPYPHLLSLTILFPSIDFHYPWHTFSQFVGPRWAREHPDAATSAVIAKALNMWKTSMGTSANKVPAAFLDACTTCGGIAEQEKTAMDGMPGCNQSWLWDIMGITVWTTWFILFTPPDPDAQCKGASCHHNCMHIYIILLYYIILHYIILFYIYIYYIYM